MTKKNRLFKLWVVFTDGGDPKTFYSAKCKKFTEQHEMRELRRMRAWIARNAELIYRATIYDLRYNQARESYTQGGVRVS